MALVEFPTVGIVNNYPTDDSPLPAGTQVRFQLGPIEHRDFVTVRIDENGRLRVMGGIPFIIRTEAPNIISIETSHS